MGYAAGDAEEEALVAMKWVALAGHKGVQVVPLESSPGTWCRSAALRSSVRTLAAQAAWSSDTSSLISLSV
jgi:hypothetical protein